MLKPSGSPLQFTELTPKPRLLPARYGYPITTTTTTTASILVPLLLALVVMSYYDN